jgi:hypothetical protein
MPASAQAMDSRMTLTKGRKLGFCQRMGVDREYHVHASTYFERGIQIAHPFATPRRKDMDDDRR